MLHDQRRIFGDGVNHNVIQLNDVWMIKFLENADFTTDFVKFRVLSRVQNLDDAEFGWIVDEVSFKDL